MQRRRRSLLKNLRARYLKELEEELQVLKDIVAAEPASADALLDELPAGGGSYLSQLPQSPVRLPAARAACQQRAEPRPAAAAPPQRARPPDWDLPAAVIDHADRKTLITTSKLLTANQLLNKARMLKGIDTIPSHCDASDEFSKSVKDLSPPFIADDLTRDDSDASTPVDDDDELFESHSSVHKREVLAQAASSSAPVTFTANSAQESPVNVAFAVDAGSSPNGSLIRTETAPEVSAGAAPTLVEPAGLVPTAAATATIVLVPAAAVPLQPSAAILPVASKTAPAPSTTDLSDAVLINAPGVADDAAIRRVTGGTTTSSSDYLMLPNGQIPSKLACSEETPMVSIISDASAFRMMATMGCMEQGPLEPLPKDDVWHQDWSTSPPNGNLLTPTSSDDEDAQPFVGHNAEVLGRLVEQAANAVPGIPLSLVVGTPFENAVFSTPPGFRALFPMRRAVSTQTDPLERSVSATQTMNAPNSARRADELNEPIVVPVEMAAPSSIVTPLEVPPSPLMVPVNMMAPGVLPGAVMDEPDTIVAPGNDSSRITPYTPTPIPIAPVKRAQLEHSRVSSGYAPVCLQPPAVCAHPLKLVIPATRPPRLPAYLQPGMPPRAVLPPRAALPAVGPRSMALHPPSHPMTLQPPVPRPVALQAPAARPVALQAQPPTHVFVARSPHEVGVRRVIKPSPLITLQGQTIANSLITRTVYSNGWGPKLTLPIPRRAA